MGKTGVRTLGRTKGIQKGNIKMHLKESGREGIGWIDLAENSDK